MPVTSNTARASVASSIGSTANSPTNDKKKKGKGRVKAPNGIHDEDKDELEDDLPVLEAMTPELESVHVSTTASGRLSRTAAAAHAELLAKADDLYRRMDAEVEGGVGMAEEEEYWGTLPAHIRDFVWTTSCYQHGQSGDGGALKAQAMYAIAQQMVQSGLKTGSGDAGANSFPFDPAIFSDPEFSEAIKRATAAHGLDLDASEYATEEEYFDDEEHAEHEHAEHPLSTHPHERNKQKIKGKRGEEGVGRPRLPEVANLIQKTGSVITPSSTMPAAATRPPPTGNPPPSSRAAGKQPMTYTTPAAPPRAQPQPKSQPPYHAHPTHTHPSPPTSQASAPHKPRPPAPNPPPKAATNSKIWNTNSAQERERIKEFWLGLGEDERRDLVKVEKEAVLKKMKEQQKHSCSCAVCGRKRSAIEEELEVLYEAYYDELEQYANYQQRYVSSGGALPPPPGPGPFPGSVELDKNGAVLDPHKPVHPPPRKTPAVNGRKAPKPSESEFEEDEGEEDDYEEEEYEDDEEEEDDEEDDEEEPEEEEDEAKPRARRAPAAAPPRARRQPDPAAKAPDGLFNFGSNLTVTGNILTVADDLLKNDGQKFLEMMEQLAERRMQREEEAAVDVEEDSEEDEEDEGDDDEDDEEDEDDEDDEEEEVMTEQQKMEEGKRMFSIFAARMFEQRVLQAYREKMAQEKQLQLLRELEDEDKAAKDKESKKQSQSQKKKDKKKQQKAAKEEERQSKLAEKAAEEAAVRAKQTALEDEQRKKKEEERQKREAARKAAEEERQRKDEERRKRLTEEKERKAEAERKRKEAEDKAKAERREREEKERKERAEREAKAAAEKAERAAAAAAKREKEQREKEEREKQLAKEKEEKEKAEREAREQRERERAAQQQQRLAKQQHRQPSSPRGAGPSTQPRSPTAPVAPKKILSKANNLSNSSIGPHPPRQQPQPQLPQQRPAVITNSNLPQPISPQVSHLPPHPVTPIYSPGGMPPSASMSPTRGPYTPPPAAFGTFPGSSSMPSLPPPGPIGPPSISRNFGPVAVPPGFNQDPTFRGMVGPLGAPPGPIGPPSKAPPAPIGTPAPPLNMAPGAPGPSRRMSVPVPDPGPITRPIAPIARPTGEPNGSGSPVRRSPSPKVLGSSALTADDDEVITPVARRHIPPGAVGQGWGNAVGSPIGGAPWGPPVPPGFGSSPRAPHHPSHPSHPPPPIGTPMWGNANVSGHPDWHPTAFFQNGAPFTSPPSQHGG